MTKWMIGTALALAALAAPATAQVGIGAFGGISMPMGDYADDTGTDAGSAKMGFSVGADLFYPLETTMEGLSWFSSAGITTHGVDDDIYGAGDVDVGRYWLFPLFTGARLELPVGTMRAYGAGQIGMVFVKGPSGEAGDNELTWEMASKFGFALSGGIQLNEKVHAGIRWVPLGEVEAEGEQTVGGSSSTFEGEVQVSFVEFLVGFRVF